MQNDTQTIQQEGREPKHSSETVGGENQLDQSAGSSAPKTPKTTRWKSHRRKDITGQRFCRYIAVRYHGMVGSSSQWLCRCDCGNERYVFLSSLVSGGPKSCGCLAAELKSKRTITHGHSVGDKKSREYMSWSSMKERCNNAKSTSYCNYGGRGIAVCPEWSDFEVFLSEMGARPPNHSLERLNYNLGYFKKNCVWATTNIQCNNKRNNHYCLVNGERKTISQLSHEYGIKSVTILARLRRGWTIERAITHPVQINCVSSSTNQVEDQDASRASR